MIINGIIKILIKGHSEHPEHETGAHARENSIKSLGTFTPVEANHRKMMNTNLDQFWHEPRWESNQGFFFVHFITNQGVLEVWKW